MTNTSWGKVAPWYDENIEQKDSYQDSLIAPNLLRILNIKSGTSVLDLACGQGFFSRKFSEKGAKVVGSDISPELIGIAKEKSSKDVVYHVSPAHNLDFAEDNSFDVITIVLAIQNISNISEVFTQCRRVLKDDGKMVIVLNHPSFRIPKKSSWGFDEETKIQYRRVEAYLTESKEEIDMNPGSKKVVKTISFHRPLQVYSKVLANASFAISRIEEWAGNRVSQDGPRKEAEDKARKEIPLFMCLECVTTNN